MQTTMRNKLKSCEQQSLINNLNLGEEAGEAIAWRVFEIEGRRATSTSEGLGLAIPFRPESNDGISQCNQLHFLG